MTDSPPDMANDFPLDTWPADVCGSLFVGLLGEIY